MSSDNSFSATMGFVLGCILTLLVMAACVIADARTRTCIERVTESGQCVAWVASK